MTNSEQAIREIVRKHGIGKYSYRPVFLTSAEKSFIPDPEFLSDLTALISEHYYPKAKYDEAVQQRDELREALEHIAEYWNRDRNDEAMHNALWEIINTAEAAIKNTDPK